MNLTKRFIIGSIVVILVTWLFNIVRYEIYSLEAPKFIKNYVEKEVLLLEDEDNNSYQGTSYIEFYYLDNATNKSYINKGVNYSEISFPEINSMEISAVNNGYGWSTYDMFNEQNYNIEGVEIYPYRLNVLRVDLNNIILRDGSTFYDKLKKDKQIDISKIQVGYGNKSREIEVGKVRITAVNDVKIENSFIEQYLSGSKSDGWNEVSYKALRNIEIQSIGSEFYKELYQCVEIKINDETLEDIVFPIKIKEGQEINISFIFDFKEKGKAVEPKLIETWLNLRLIDSNMKEEERKVFLCNWYYSIADVLKEMGNLNKVFNE